MHAYPPSRPIHPCHLPDGAKRVGKHSHEPIDPYFPKTPCANAEDSSHLMSWRVTHLSNAIAPPLPTNTIPPSFLFFHSSPNPNNFLDIISRSHPRHTHPSRRQIQSRSPPPRPHEPLSLSPRPPPTQPIILQLPRQLAHFFLGVVSRL